MNAETQEAEKNEKRLMTERPAESRFRNGKCRKNFEENELKVTPIPEHKVLKPHKNTESEKSNRYPTKPPKVSNPASCPKSEKNERPSSQLVQSPQPIKESVELPKNLPKMLQQSEPSTNNSQNNMSENMENTFLNKNGFYNMYNASQLQQIYMQQMLKSSYINNPYQYLQLGYYQNYPTFENLHGNGILNGKNLTYFLPNPTGVETNSKPTPNPIPPPTKQESFSQASSVNLSVSSPMQKVSNLTEQSIGKTEVSDPYSHINIFSLKSKSYNHVAIAYNIHFEKLKEKGKFNQNDMEKMDPTFYARKLKMQKIK